MINDDRTEHVNRILKQLDFCIDLAQRLKHDIEEGQRIQNDDPYDKWYGINGRSRYGDDIVRIRREFNVLKKILEEA